MSIFSNLFQTKFIKVSSLLVSYVLIFGLALVTMLSCIIVILFILLL